MSDRAREAEPAKRGVLATLSDVVIVVALVMPGVVVFVLAEWLMERSPLFVIPLVAWLVLVVVTGRRWARESASSGSRVQRRAVLVGPPRRGLVVVGVVAMLAIAFVCVVVPVSDGGGVRGAWLPFGRYMVFFWAVWALITAVISSRITIRNEVLELTNILRVTTIRRSSIAGVDARNGIVIRTVRGSEHFVTAYQQSALQVWFTSARFEEVASRIREWSLARPEELHRSEGSSVRERDRDATVVLRKLVWFGWPLGLLVSQLIAVGVWLASPWLYLVVVGAP